MKKPILELKNICFQYEKNVEVLHDISFSVGEGEFISLIGSNGSGKSTLSKIISCILTPSKGEIFLYGSKIDSNNKNDLKNLCGIVFQNPDNQFIGATVEDDVAFGLENRNIENKKMHELVSYYLNKVKMNGYENRMPSELSGGQKQRVAIAGVLALGMKIIILDEATSMLDPEGVRDIKKLISDIRKENKSTTIISITHNIEEAYDSDRVIVLDNGKIFADGNPKKVLLNEKVIKSIHLEQPFIFKLLSELKNNGVHIENEIKDLDSLARLLCKSK